MCIYIYMSFQSEKIIPHDLSNHQYINAENVRYSENLYRIQPWKLHVSSKSRNYNLETPQDYTNIFSNYFNNVFSIELVDGYLPSSGYNVTVYNNVLYFQTTFDEENEGTYKQAIIPPGFYTIDELSTEIKNKMELACSAQGETVTFVVGTNLDTPSENINNK